VYLLACFLGGILYFLSKWAWARGLAHWCGDREAQAASPEAPWRRRPHYATWLLGVAFGLKLGLGNWGLDLVSVDYHVLFECTALLWVALAGALVLGERPSRSSWAVIAAMVAGQVLLGLQFSSEPHASLLGITVNLLTPTLQGLCVVLTRYSALLLFPDWITKGNDDDDDDDGDENEEDGRSHSNDDGRAIQHRSARSHTSGAIRVWNVFGVLNLDCIMEDHGGETFAFHVDTLVAFTSVKLLFSFLACAPASLLMEGFLSDRPFWTAITGDNAGFLCWNLAIGSVVTFLLQASLVLLAMISVALSLGVLSVVKIVPQLGAGIWFSRKTFAATPMHVSGVALILGASLAYAAIKVAAASGTKAKRWWPASLRE